MKSKWTVLAGAALTVAVLAAMGSPAAADDLTLDDMAADVVPMEVLLHVSYQVHHRYLAGDPPTTARGSTEISFTKRGVYTFVRFKPGFGMQYHAIPGFLDDPQFPEVTNIRVRETHTCHDDQMFIIGRQSQDLSGSAEVHPASGAITVSSAGDGADGKIRIALSPWRLETDYVPCTTQPYCFDDRTFHFSGDVGEERDAWVETPEGHQQYEGMELAVVDWSVFRSFAEGGGELALVIPVAVTHTEQTGGDAGDFESTITLFTATGVIAPVDQLPLEPLVPVEDD